MLKCGRLRASFLCLMKKYLIILSVVLAPIFTGCDLFPPSFVEFRIANNSGQEILNLEVDASEPVCNGENFIEILAHGDIAELELDFFYEKETECIQPKLDGSYLLAYYIGEEEYIYSFGYYSNGIPLDEEFDIEIREEGISVNGFEVTALQD